MPALSDAPLSTPAYSLGVHLHRCTGINASHAALWAGIAFVPLAEKNMQIQSVRPTGGANRRRSRRCSESSTVTAAQLRACGTRLVQLNLLDVSLHGLRAQTEADLKIGDIFTAAIPHVDGATPSRLAAEGGLIYASFIVRRLLPAGPAGAWWRLRQVGADLQHASVDATTMRQPDPMMRRQVRAVLSGSQATIRQVA